MLNTKFPTTAKGLAEFIGVKGEIFLGRICKTGDQTIIVANRPGEKFVITVDRANDTVTTRAFDDRGTEKAISQKVLAFH